MARYLPSVKRYSWILLACIAIAVIVGALLLRAIPPAYVASSTLVVQAPAMATGASALTSDPTRAIAEANSYAAQVPSREAMTLVSKLYPELRKHGYTTYYLMHNVTASPDTTAATVTIQATGRTPHDAVMIANDVAQGFGAFVAQQMQGQLNTVRTNLQQQLNAFQQQRSELEAKILKIQSTTTTTTTSGTNGTNTPGAPGITGTNSSSTNTTTTISSDPTLIVYTADLASLNQTIASLQTQISSLPATATGDAAVIQLATPADASPSARPILIAAATLAASIILGLLLIALMIYLDRSLLAEDEVKEKLGLPYLGGLSTDMTLAAAPASAGAIPAQEGANIFASLLLTNLALTGRRDHLGLVILVTSAREAEGKTTVACALAGSVVRSGGTVAVIDANLPQPATHLALGVDPTGSGLSGLLTSEGPTEEALLQVGETPVLWLLPAGSAIETPTLLMRERFPQILDQIRQTVDVVIIDSPALLNSADGVLLANMADYVTLVVDARHSKLAPLEHATDLLTSLSGTPAGIILNRLPSKRRIRYYATAIERRATIARRLPALPGGEQVVTVPVTERSGGVWQSTSTPPRPAANGSGANGSDARGTGAKGSVSSENGVATATASDTTTTSD